MPLVREKQKNPLERGYEKGFSETPARPSTPAGKTKFFVQSNKCPCPPEKLNQPTLLINQKNESSTNGSRQQEESYDDTALADGSLAKDWRPKIGGNYGLSPQGEAKFSNRISRS